MTLKTLSILNDFLRNSKRNYITLKNYFREVHIIIVHNL